MPPNKCAIERVVLFDDLGFVLRFTAKQDYCALVKGIGRGLSL